MKVAVILSLFIISMSLVLGLNFTFNDNITELERVDFNTSIGNYSFGSGSYSNLDDFLNFSVDVCGANFTDTMTVTAGYFTQSRSLTSSLVYFPYVVENISATCQTFYFDLATTKAYYPGYVSIILNDMLNTSYVDNGTTIHNSTTTKIVSNESIFLNGSYDVEVGIQVIPQKTYLLSPSTIFDQLGRSITQIGEHIHISLIYKNGTVRGETQTNPNGFLPFDENFVGGEKVVINGIESLEIRTFAPCDGDGRINESGYYIMNTSISNANRTCVTVENLTNTIINFGGEEISGDANESKIKDTCPITVKNSQNITVENLRVNEFYNGICIENSSVVVFGQGSTFNVNGAFITNKSRVYFGNVSFTDNTGSELSVYNDSSVEFDDVSFTNLTKLRATFVDAIVKGVTVRPPDPEGFGNVSDIGQYIEFTNSSLNNSWAQISFVYEFPLPNGVATDNISIFKYNGTYVNRTTFTFNATTNTTTNSSEVGWFDGNWTNLDDPLVDEDVIVIPSLNVVRGPNVSTFSVFAPFAYQANSTAPDPVPEPEPNPDPDPESGPSSGGGGGSGGGSGGDPGLAVDVVDSTAASVELNLSLPERITIQQGEVTQVEFNITNIGAVTANSVIVGPFQLDEWEMADSTQMDLSVGETESNIFTIGPFENIVPRTYSVRVNAYASDGRIVTVGFMDVRVIPKENVKRIRVLEYPPVIRAEPFTELGVSFFMKNVGTRDLEDIRIEYSQTTCIRGIQGSHDLEINEENILPFTLQVNQPGECDVTLNFYDIEDDLVGFVPITIINEYNDEDAVNQSKYILLLLLLFTTTLSVWVILRR